MSCAQSWVGWSKVEARTFTWITIVGFCEIIGWLAAKKFGGSFSKVHKSPLCRTRTRSLKPSSAMSHTDCDINKHAHRDRAPHARFASECSIHEASQSRERQQSRSSTTKMST